MANDRYFAKALEGRRHIIKYNPDEHDLEDFKKNYYEVDRLGDLLARKVAVKKAVKKPAKKTTKKTIKKAAKKTKK